MYIGLLLLSAGPGTSLMKYRRHVSTCRLFLMQLYKANSAQKLKYASAGAHSTTTFAYMTITSNRQLPFP